jgi:hypothetical protein
MEFIWRRWRMLGVVALLLTVAGSAIAARPHTVASSGLGAEWQCSRTLFVLTCSHPLKR